MSAKKDQVFLYKYLKVIVKNTLLKIILDFE